MLLISVRTDSLIQSLLQKGVPEKTAKRLAKEHPDRIADEIEALPYRDPKVPVAVLIAAIQAETAYTVPPALIEKRAQRAKEQKRREKALQDKAIAESNTEAQRRYDALSAEEKAPIENPHQAEEQNAAREREARAVAKANIKRLDAAEKEQAERKAQAMRDRGRSSRQIQETEEQKRVQIRAGLPAQFSSGQVGRW